MSLLVRRHLRPLSLSAGCYLLCVLWEPNIWSDLSGYCLYPLLEVNCLWARISSALLFSHSVLSDSLRPHGLQHARPRYPSPTPRVYSDSCPLSWWCHPIISFSVVPLSCPQSFPAQGLFQWVSSSHQVAKVLEFHLQHQSFQWIFRTDFLQDGLVGSPCSPRDSQESSPAPQLNSINSSVLSFLYRPTLASIHD